MLVGVFEAKEKKFKIFTQTTYGIREIQQKGKDESLLLYRPI